MSLELLQPMLQGGIRNTNFFNGRLLTADDLRAEQAANRQQHQQLGVAVGAGVVEGYDVQLAPTGNSAKPVLRVTKGLAITRKGAALALAEDVDVALVRQPKTALLSGDAGLFAVCRPEATTPSATIAEGVYVFVVSPASGFTEHAPVVGFNGNGVASGCDHRYAVEGVRFGLVGVDLAQLSFVDAATRGELVQLLAQTNPASRTRLRNRLAHLCFGTAEAASFATDPFRLLSGQSPLAAGYGLIDWMRSRGDLTQCDVPLALLLWTTAGVQFVDLWSVRRTPTPPPVSSVWPLQTGSRRPGEGEAAFLQFQTQLADMVASGVFGATLTQLHALDLFRYLPAAGMVPLATSRYQGFELADFFAGMAVPDPVHITGDELAALLRMAHTFPPIDLGRQQQELVWLYLVRENMEAVAVGGAAPPQPYVVFSSGHMPYAGQARYSLDHWNFANYA